MPFDSRIFPDRDAIKTAFGEVRRNSERLAEPLSAEDWMLQSMPDASPVKWNLAHTSWFFETFILSVHAPDYEIFHEQFGYLFNSYYNLIGKMHPRPTRGLLSRPTAKEVMAYRAHVSEAMQSLIDCADDDAIEKIEPLIALGIAHEEQHQELLLTDLKHGLYQNPMLPAAYTDDGGITIKSSPPTKWERMEGGICEIGFSGGGFSFDNEGPRHKVFLHPFELASRPVTNSEFIEFIEEGGYDCPEHWLADGWALLNEEGWKAPLYWAHKNGNWCEYTLFGERQVDPHAPVCHVSFFEAAAFASWADARLPTEFEWEAAASLFPLQGRFLDAGIFASPRGANGEERLLQLFGDVWEWTASPYVAYPGFSPPRGAIGEYNGKFMSGQMVLRGGSSATPADHLRLSYRNFFQPAARWQFSGFRLARDV